MLLLNLVSTHHIASANSGLSTSSKPKDCHPVGHLELKAHISAVLHPIESHIRDRICGKIGG